MDERIEDTGPTQPRVDPEEIAKGLGAKPCSVPAGLPTNIWKNPIRVKHSELKRASKESSLKSICPACPDGLLLMRRDQETFELKDADCCIGCGQTVIYEDIARLRGA